MKEIKEKVDVLTLLIDERGKLLFKALKRNYKHFNETALDSEKILPHHLKIEFELNDLLEDVANDIRRIELIGKAFGVSVEYITNDSDEQII